MARGLQVLAIYSYTKEQKVLCRGHHHKPGVLSGYQHTSREGAAVEGSNLAELHLSVSWVCVTWRLL